MQALAQDLGVRFQFGEAAREIIIEKGKAKTLITDKGRYTADAIISGADYQFTESALLPEAYRTYSPAYWDKKVLAPSCLLYYVGLNKKIDGLLHHNLFFDVPFDKHADQIYTNPKWPEDPLFYLNIPSKTDSSCAPAGCENLMVLIPVASGLTGDTEKLREHYFDLILQRLEKHTGQSLTDAIVFKKSFSLSDFISEYNSYKGNAYGLANTLLQTAVFKPSCRSKKVDNLFYTGQFTVPGPGVPPSLISGEVVSKQLMQTFKEQDL
jgi:phytoene desaturase